MRASQKPRELSNRYGYTALATDELLALVLVHGTISQSVFELSPKIADICTSCLGNHVPKSGFAQSLRDKFSLGQVKTHQLCALYELLLRQASVPNVVEYFTTPQKLAEKFYRLATKKQEYVYGIYLSSRLAIVHVELLTKGTTDSVSIDVRDVLYFGIKHRVRQVILVHNHPSGVPEPSAEDTEITKKIAAAAKLMSMQLLDHIIVAKQGYFSFKASTGVL